MGVLFYFIFILLYFMQTKQTLFRVQTPRSAASEMDQPCLHMPYFYREYEYNAQ